MMTCDSHPVLVLVAALAYVAGVVTGALIGSTYERRKFWRAIRDVREKEKDKDHQP